MPSNGFTSIFKPNHHFLIIKRLKSATLMQIPNKATSSPLPEEALNRKIAKTWAYSDEAKPISYSYNRAGQLIGIQDQGTQTQTRYQYDEAGNRLTESVTQNRDSTTHV